MQIRVGEWTSQDFGPFQNLINKTLNVEAMAMERETGIPFETLAQDVARGTRTSITAFVWVLRKREEPTLKFNEVVWREEDLELIVTDADKARMEEDARKAEEEALADPQAAGDDEAGQTHLDL